MKIEIIETDLWGDGEGGWSANCCWANRTTITVPADASDLAIVRRIKKAAGIQGMRRDEWCVADFGPWRYQGIGAYADVIE